MRFSVIDEDSMAYFNCAQSFRKRTADACRVALSLEMPRSVCIAVQCEGNLQPGHVNRPAVASIVPTDSLYAILAADRCPFVQMRRPIQSHTDP